MYSTTHSQAPGHAATATEKEKKAAKARIPHFTDQRYSLNDCLVVSLSWVSASAIVAGADDYQWIWVPFHLLDDQDESNEIVMQQQ